VTTTLRWVLIVVGMAGVLLSTVGFVDFVQVIRSNSVTDGEPVGLQDHYLQLGAFYSRGFTTGFFFCFSLMLVAVAIGAWYDERVKARRARALGRVALPDTP
jgi:hypothetical protein